MSKFDQETKDATKSVKGLTRATEKLGQQRYKAPSIPQARQAPARRGFRNNTALIAGGKAALGAAAAYLSLAKAIDVYRNALDTASQEEAIQQRLRALTRGFDDLDTVLAVATRAQEKFNLSTRESQKQLANLYARLRPIGLSLGEIESVLNGFNTAAALTGATAQESAGALLQLTQALGSGYLRGQEFNSVAEQAPAIIRAIGKELDVPIGKLKDLAADGAITADVVVRALQRIEKEGAGQLAEALDTSAQKFQKLDNKLQDFNAALGRLLLPATIALVEALTLAVEVLTDDLDKLNRIFADLNGTLAPLNNVQLPATVTLMTAVEGAVKGVKEAVIGLASALNPAIQSLNNFLKLYEIAGTAGLFGVLDPNRETTAPVGGYTISGRLNNSSTSLSDRLGVGLDSDSSSGGSSGGSKGSTPRNDTERAKDLLRTLQDQQQLLAASSKIEREMLQIEQERRDTLLDINKFQGVTDTLREQLIIEANRLANAEQLEVALTKALDATAKEYEARRNALEPLEQERRLLEAKLNGTERQVALEIEAERIAKDSATLTKAEVLEQLKLNEALEKEVSLREANQQIINDVVNGAGRELTNLFEALVVGTEDWNKTLQDSLRSLSKLLLNAGLNALGGGDGKGFFSLLSGGITGRATGGPVSSGTPYLVGEKGPELMVPGRSGSVVPNNALGGSTVVNITINENGGGTTAASGPNKQSAAQMARLIESSTLAIINREKRPGGTLSPRGN